MINLKYIIQFFQVSQNIKQISSMQESYKIISSQENNCVICLQIASNAVESKCCHQLFCQFCANSIIHAPDPRCPMCRTKQLICSLSPKREKINNTKVLCRHCKQSWICIEIQKHQQQCQKYPLACKYCKQKLLKSQLLTHLMNKHKQVLEKLVFADCKGQFTQSFSKKQFVQSQLKRKVKIGKTGKYYCQGKLQGPKCVCCNGYCGPSNGQNCLSCMKLDLKRRGLQKGFLVNGQGFVCWKQKGYFKCQKMLNNGQGYCGQGVYCKFCLNLNTTVERYQSLL